MLFARLFSLGFWIFCDACLLPWMRFVLVYTCPLCDSCLWRFLVGLASWSTFGAHAWGVPFVVDCLGWVLPPLFVCEAGSIPLVYLSAPSMCFVQLLGSGVSLGCSRLSWLARSSRIGCFTFFLFLDLFCFVFPYPDSLALLCLWWCLSGCFFPPWPSFLGRHVCL